MGLKKTDITIAIDAMGGDHAPFSVIEGSALFLKNKNNINFLIFGDKNIILPIISKFPKLERVSTIIHTSKKVSASEKPSSALRKGKESSMWLAIEAASTGKAHAVISAGNTGALMIMSKLIFRSINGIDRPAIASILPTQKNCTVLLDMGANSACDANNLAQFAIMGDAFAKAALNLPSPSIGLLNIGSEELKGHDVVRVAHQIISDEYTHLNYYGYVEGDDIMKGTSDVVVTDGFTGNIALKSIEGTAKMLKSVVKSSIKKSILARLGLLLTILPLKKTLKKLDPRNHNGAMFLGLNGICVKSHGNADKVAFASALKVTLNLIDNKINDKIIEELKLINNNSIND